MCAVIVIAFAIISSAILLIATVNVWLSKSEKVKLTCYEKQLIKVMALTNAFCSIMITWSIVQMLRQTFLYSSPTIVLCVYYCVFSILVLQWCLGNDEKWKEEQFEQHAFQAMISMGVYILMLLFWYYTQWKHWIVYHEAGKKIQSS